MLFYNSEYMKLFKYTLLHIIVICSIVCGCSEDIMSTDGTLHGKGKIELNCEINNYRHQLSPVIHRGSPLKMKKVRVHK